jgi:hypothetical protein
MVQVVVDSAPWLKEELDQALQVAGSLTVRTLLAERLNRLR